MIEALPAISIHAALVVGGLCGGLLGGMLGIGGALLTLPTLYFALPALGVAPQDVPSTAVQCALLAMVPTALVAAWRQHRHGAIESTWVRRLATPMLIGAILGALLAAHLRGPVLALLFSAQSCWYGARLVFDCAPSDHAAAAMRVPTWLAGTFMAAFCACAGMGGGSMVSPFLLHRGVDLRHAVATSSALNLTIAFGGSGAIALLCHAVSTSAPMPCWPAALLLGASSVLAVPIGVCIGHRLPKAALRMAVGAINVTAAIVLIVQTFRLA